ncbi:glycoside hydrolase family 18 protein, partial [Conidiobolus coronatus NRRL 28638]
PWGKTEPSAINYSALTHINYGFGTLHQKNSPANITIDQYYDGARIKELKKYGSQNNVKVLMSIGGWTGSQTFSIVAKDSGLINQFVQNALYFVRKDGYDLDGIDIDWEYPVCQGSDNNAKDPNDSSNYLNLLKALRAALDKEFGAGNKLITAAVRVQPFFDPSCNPMSDVSAFAQFFDFINIMAYDIMGPWSSTTGPNAPHNADPKNSNTYSFTQSIQSWTKAGFPANKLVGGLAFYGHSMTATVDMTADPSNIYVSKSSAIPKGDEFDACEANAINNEGA